MHVLNGPTSIGQTSDSLYLYAISKPGMGDACVRQPHVLGVRDMAKGRQEHIGLLCRIQIGSSCSTTSRCIVQLLHSSARGS
jgi:hypothetical protein